MKSTLLLFSALLIMAGCSKGPIQQGSSDVSSANLGKHITVEGHAENRKFGAQLVGANFDLWIEGLHEWPDGYTSQKNNGKRVQVTGILAEDYGLPVFIDKKDKLPIQGIPVPEGTDLKKASHRYLLKDARWKLMDD